MASFQSKDVTDEAFRSLLLKLSQNLRQENVQELAMMGGRARSGTLSALDVLLLLWEKGEFSPRSCAGLDKLLRDIARHDLLYLAEQYMDTYGTSKDPQQKQCLQQPVQEMETRCVKDPPTLSLPPVTRTASGPSTVSTAQDHGNDDGSVSERRRALSFCYDHLEEGYPADAGTMRSQVSYTSFPASSHMSSQPRFQGSEEVNSSQFVSASSENSHIAIKNYGTINISSNSDHSGNSNHSSLSPPVRGQTHSGKNSAPQSSMPPSSSHRKSSNPEQERIPTITPLPEETSSEEQLEDKNEVDTSDTVRCKMATDMSPVPSSKSDEKADTVREKVATDVLPGSSTKSDGGNATTRHKKLLPAPSPKCEDRPYLTHIKGMQAEATSESPKEGRKWTRVPRPKRLHELTKQCTWVVKKTQLVSFIWNYKHHHRHIKYHRKLQVDINCADSNPRLSFLLYPFGLFEDEGKSVTMLVKIKIPDKCPPLPPTATYILSCKVHEGNNGELLQGTERQMKQPFDKGTFYVKSFFTHATINHCKCDKLEIHIVSTCQL